MEDGFSKEGEIEHRKYKKKMESNGERRIKCSQQWEDYVVERITNIEELRNASCKSFLKCVYTHI